MSWIEIPIWFQIAEWYKNMQVKILGISTNISSHKKKDIKSICVFTGIP